MAINAARGILITKAYRYAVEEDFAIKGSNSSAKQIQIDTNLDESTAEALAASLFPLVSAYSRTFTVDVEALIYPEDYIGGTPRFVVNFTNHPAGGTNKTYTLIGSKCDYMRGVTSVTVRG